MHLSYILLVAAASLLASCETVTATEAAVQTTVSQMAASDVMQSAEVATNTVPGHRRLRTAGAAYLDDEAADDEDDDDDDDDGGIADEEERGFSVSAETVNKMLASKSFRRGTFREWDEAGRAYNDIKKIMSDPKILRKYRKYLGITWN